jgi:hypothetical protein
MRRPPSSSSIGTARGRSRTHARGVRRQGSDNITTYLDWDDEGARERSVEELVYVFDATWDLMYGALSRWDTGDIVRTFPHT